ncbi:MAG: hypothetical protein ACI4MQ_03520 [Candidatus Coproplasma sp.]
MKTQMKFQKIISLVSLIVAAVVFVYALSFFSGNLSDLLGYISQFDDTFTVADDFLYSGQAFVSNMVTISIVFFCVIAFIYITSTNTRRNYYITNYIAIGLITFMCVFVALFGIINICVLMGKFYGLDWTAISNYYLNNTDYVREVSKSPAIFIIGLVVFLLVLALAAVWVYNLIWKKKLMDGEKALLAGAAPSKEVENNEVAEEGV